MKEKLKSYEFWVSIVSAVVVVLQSLSLKFNLPFIQEVVMGFLGVLAVAGLIKKSQPPIEGDSETTEEESTSTQDTQEKDRDEDVNMMNK